VSRPKTFSKYLRSFVKKCKPYLSLLHVFVFACLQKILDDLLVFFTNVIAHPEDIGERYI